MLPTKCYCTYLNIHHGRLHFIWLAKIASLSLSLSLSLPLSLYLSRVHNRFTGLSPSSAGFGTYLSYALNIISSILSIVIMARPLSVSGSSMNMTYLSSWLPTLTGWVIDWSVGSFVRLSGFTGPIFRGFRVVCCFVRPNRGLRVACRRGCIGMEYFTLIYYFNSFILPKVLVYTLLYIYGFTSQRIF